jgi:predicted nucleic acid-binding protein
VHGDETIVTPTLFWYEVTNAVRRRMARHGLSRSDADELLAYFLGLPITAGPALHERALAIADAYSLPAAYDAHYVALAEQVGCDFWTDDIELVHALRGDFSFVRRIADYPL